jgi:hypothetical protein
MPTLLPFLSFPFNSILLFKLLLLVMSVVRAQEASTATLLGPPRVRCGDSTIRVTLSTSEAFEGAVYAKGFFGN